MEYLETISGNFSVEKGDKYWRARRFLSLEYEDDLLSMVVTHKKKRQDSAPVIHEGNSFFLGLGRFFYRSYNSSKRRIMLGHEIEEYLPEIKRLYYHDMAPVISKIVGQKLYPVPMERSLSLMVLIYDSDGDYIGWHSDRYYLREDQKIVTALLCLENKSNQHLCIENSQPSFSNFSNHPPHHHHNPNNPHKKETTELGMLDEEQLFSAPLNYDLLSVSKGDMIVFEHKDTKHAIFPKMKQGESRIMISMVFAEYPYPTTVQHYVWEKFKNVSHYPLYHVFSPIDKMFLLLFFFLCVVIACVLVYGVYCIIQFIRYERNQRNEGNEANAKNPKKQ